MVNQYLGNMSLWLPLDLSVFGLTGAENLKAAIGAARGGNSKRSSIVYVKSNLHCCTEVLGLSL